MPADQDAAARETLELLLQASARLDRMDATTTTITLTRAALTLQAISAPSTNGGVAIALMQAALVLLDRDGRRDAACRLQGALDTALSLKRMAPDEEVSVEMIDALLPISRTAE